MGEICVDTDVLIDLARRKLIGYVERDLGLCLTIISLYEYLRGLAFIGRDVVACKEELENRFRVLPLSNNALIKASEIYSELRGRGLLVPDPDLLIASICIVNGVPLATHNRSHYERMTRHGLELVEPRVVVELVEERCKRDPMS